MAGKSRLLDSIRRDGCNTTRAILRSIERGHGLEPVLRMEQSNPDAVVCDVLSGPEAVPMESHEESF